MLDLCSPAAILGYGIGRLGCLFSGDGDYGIPTNLPWGMSFNKGLVPSGPYCQARGLPWDCGMHPTPIYELLASLLIFWFLWRVADPKRGPKPAGTILAFYLILSGLERFLVEFIRLNPHSAFGIFSNAQFMALLSMIAGALLLWWVRRRPALHPFPAGH
jgi:phosphatidylglycerol:prolipoprotein diacylglycerol transferase